MKTEQSYRKIFSTHCDNCREHICFLDEASMEYVEVDGEAKSDLAIVHTGCCSTDDTRPHYDDLVTTDLKWFVDNDGLFRLIALIEKAANEGNADRIKNICEIIKRLHQPGYESARDFFEVYGNVLGRRDEFGGVTHENITEALKALAAFEEHALFEE